MATSSEQNHWDKWNLDRVRDGLIGERLGLCDEAVAEVRRLSLPKGSRVLEVGCGAGWVAEQVAAGFEYLGLDLAPATIEQARLRVPGADFEAVNFVEWEVPVGKYDAVICVDSIACFHEQHAAIAKMRDALKPGGHLLITTVNPVVYSRLKWVGPPGEGQARNWLTRTALHRLLTENGFSVLRSRTILPTGDQGFLRLINARKVRTVVSPLFLGRRRFERAKEALGLGQFRVVMARKRTDA